MTTKPEQLIGMAERLYSARRHAKQIMGADYQTRIAEYKDVLANYAKVRSMEIIPAMIDLVKGVQERFDSGITSMMLMAAAVDIIEPEEVE